MKNLLIIIICSMFLIGCTSTKPYCPTYAGNKDTLNHLGIEKYTTVVSLQGDTTFVAVPYKPHPIEKILEKGMAFSIAAMIIFTLVEHDKE